MEKLTWDTALSIKIRNPLSLFTKIPTALTRAVNRATAIHKKRGMMFYHHSPERKKMRGFSLIYILIGKFGEKL